jgi:predicted nucleotide-binding protein
MARGRTAGTKNRNYPAVPLSRALAVARAIEHEASGMTTNKLTLATLLGTTPTSRKFRELIGSSRFYGLTNGGVNADEFELTELGTQAASDDPAIRDPALKRAVLSVAPYRTFFETFKNKKVPTHNPMVDFLVRDAGIDSTQTDEVIEHILADAATAGFTRKVQNSDWIDLSGTPAPLSADEPGDEDEDDHGADTEPTDDADQEADADTADDDAEADDGKAPELPAETPRRSRPNAIFVGHGKNKKPRDQLTKILGEYGIPYKVALDEPNRGRPIPVKVKETMQECGAAVLIFSADEELFDKDHSSVWRPSENVVHELGAASIMYDNRIIIFREETVDMATNYESIGYITFEHDDLTAKANDLFRELIAFGILKVSVSDG